MRLFQEVGDESKLTQSIKRIRALIRKKRQEQRQNESNSRLERIVREVMQRQAEEQAFGAGNPTEAPIRRRETAARCFQG